MRLADRGDWPPQVDVRVVLDVPTHDAGINQRQIEKREQAGVLSEREVLVLRDDLCDGVEVAGRLVRAVTVVRPEDRRCGLMRRSSRAVDRAEFLHGVEVGGVRLTLQK